MTHVKRNNQNRYIYSGNSRTQFLKAKRYYFHVSNRLEKVKKKKKKKKKEEEEEVNIPIP